jgi:uncharacterized coiled-coil protein SlyX
VSDGEAQSPADMSAEVEALRARVAELEGQLAQQARATNEIVARSQEKLYWLERWHVDLDKVMSKPGAQQTLEGVKRLRGAVRAMRRTKRRIVG